MAMKMPNVVPPIPGAAKTGPMAAPMAGLAGPQTSAPTAATPGAAGPNAAQQAFAKQVMGWSPEKFAQMMQKLGAGPVVG